MFERINKDVFEQGLIELRREFHRYPELCWTEFRTTARIIEELEKLGLTVQYGSSIHTKEKMFGLPDSQVLENCWQQAKAKSTRPDLIDAMRGGYTGCLTVIEGALPGPTIGIRLDIDCNELQESDDQKHRPVAEGFSSEHSTCMHACGHDAHAAIGVGVAQLLCVYRDRLRGKVILGFQPCEEGLRGAASFTAAKHFSLCDYFFSAHVGLKNLRVGTVAASAHGFLDSTKFDVTFKGVPAHSGISPEEGKNALATAATAVLNMLAIPRHQEGATRINIGSLHSGTARNVIPSDATLVVETRGATTAINEYMETSAKRICRAAADMYGCSYTTRFMGAASSIECDPPLIRRTAEILAQVDGVDEVLFDFNFGACEDVTTIMRDVKDNGGQVTELIIGMPLVAPHHNNYFDIDERVIGIGSRCFAQIALMIGDE